jgi:ankyrin repeat protein
MAALKCEVEILEKMWKWAKELQLNPEDLRNALLLSKDNYNRTPLHKASLEGKVEVLEKVWEWAKKLQLRSEELRNEV